MNDIEKLIQDLGQEIKLAKDEEYKTEALMRLQEIAKTYRGQDEVISSYDLYEKIKEEPPQRKIMTGLKGFDEILDGFRETQLIVVSGITKHGKTSFAVDLTSRLSAENPLWLPFEEPAREIIMKFHDRGEKPPLFYTPTRMAGNTLNWIEKKIIESKAKYDTKIIFVDHLHFIIDNSKENVAQEIGRTMRDLKKLAVKWNVVLVLLAHLKKTRLDENPDLEDLKDSSSIAQEADTVIFMWRQTERINGEVVITNNVNVSVQANRRTGKTGNVKLVYVNGKFLEQPWEVVGLEKEKWQ